MNRAIFSFSLILISNFIKTNAFATESVDCINEIYSISVSLNLSDNSFGGYRLYKGNTMVSSGMAKQPPTIDVNNLYISLITSSERYGKIELITHTNNNGKITIDNKTYNAVCDWSAFK